MRVRPDAPPGVADPQFAGLFDETELFTTELSPAMVRIVAGGRDDVEKAQ